MVCDAVFCQLFDMKRGLFAKLKTVAVLYVTRQAEVAPLNRREPQKRHSIISARQRKTPDSTNDCLN